MVSGVFRLRKRHARMKHGRLQQCLVRIQLRRVILHFTLTAVFSLKAQNGESRDG